VTRWGAEVVVGAPRGASDTWKLDGSAQVGRLDLLGLFTLAGTDATWDSQLLPGLSASGKARRGGRLTVTVTDAGQPVSGATVRAGGHSAKTGGSGTARLNLGRHHPRAVKVNVSQAGYASASLRVRLPR
jgi:hypothetical protein